MLLDKKALDEQEYLMMFNRAVEYNDAMAWQILHEHFSGMMHYWLRQCLTHSAGCYLESEENCIALAFERFWYATSFKQHIHFETLAAALYYLRVSIRSVAIDIIRTHKRNEFLSIQQVDTAEMPAEEGREEAYELWQEIQKALPGEREQRIAYLLFNCNLKPRQVIQHCSQEFSDVQELYRVRKKVYDHFTRNADTLRWRLQ